MTVVVLLMALEAVQLCGGSRDEQLEEEGAVRAPEPLAQTGQPFGLAAVQICVALRVETDEDLDEGRVEGLDVLGEVGAVLEVELVLAGALDGHGQRDTQLQGASGHC